MYHASCTVYYPDQQIRNIYINIYIILYNVKYSYMFQRIHIITAYKKHQDMDYTYKTVQIVYAATKQTIFMYCNYNT